MPYLAHLKRKVAICLDSGALEAETRQTEVCAYLSAFLLLGLGLNAWVGWWWADPIAGLIMVPLIAWEGVDAVRGAYLLLTLKLFIIRECSLNYGCLPHNEATLF
jgi:divalent metal cation (Fe/Co/Zn/Cd) transporter